MCPLKGTFEKLFLDKQSLRLLFPLILILQIIIRQAFAQASKDRHACGVGGPPAVKELRGWKPWISKCVVCPMYPRTPEPFKAKV